MPPMRWREAAVAIAALFVVTRGALVLIALFLENNIPLAHHGPSYATGPLLTSLTGSDAVYLLGIAAEGYHAEPVRELFRDWAFFPLYPVVVRVASIGTLGNIPVAGVLVSNLAFVAALAALYALSVRHLDHDRAVRGLAFVALAPGAVAFAMAYTDSLFLLLAVGAFLAAEQRRWWLMALLYGLATLTRLQGLLLGVPLAILIAAASMPAGTSGAWRRLEAWRTRDLGWLAAGPIAFVLFMAYLGARFGEPFGMFTAQRAWSDIGKEPTGPVTPVLDRLDPLVLLVIGTLCFYLFLTLRLRRSGFPASMQALGAVMFATNFGAMFTNPSLIQSVARYMAVVWPFGWALAGRHLTMQRAIGLAASAMLFVVFALLNFTQALAP
jgi:hypothetical protein